MVQLPAHNTPQFDWARNKTGQRLQPVPPTHVPQVAARAILRAAPDAPREIWLGRVTIEAILGTILLDQIMARRAYDAQMGEPETMPNRRDNLYEPVDDLHRTAGRLTERTLDSTPGLSSERLGQLLTAAAVAVAIMPVALG